MKPKNLKKKIRQLEKRLREGPKKLAKLKRKLQAAEAKKPSKAQAKKVGLNPKAQAKTAGAKSQSASMKVKRKLNLSPERRAALSAAMKARWAAKRAAAAPNPPTAAWPGQGFPSPGPV
jgi:hypothetical protein